MLVELFFPKRCDGCGVLGPSPCAGCIDQLVPLASFSVRGVETCVALVDYDSLSRRFVAGFKYRGNRSSLDWFVSALADRLLWEGIDADLVTWAPALPASRRRRGFDPGERLANALARRTDLRCRGLLERQAGRAQTGEGRRQRLDGPTLRLRRRAGDAGLAGTRVLLVDDVVTTGATVSAAAEAIGAAGAIVVSAVAIAHPRDPTLVTRSGERVIQAQRQVSHSGSSP
ncbi:MAG: ComF family protein [Acidimicrobiales bacterium]